MAKKNKSVTEFFNENVSVYFSFFEKKFGFRPSFDGSAPRDLKIILEAMKARSLEHGVDWTSDLSTKMFETFLEFSYKEDWLRENFFLFNLNRQKDKIFYKIKCAIDGKSNSETGKPKHFGSHKTAGQDIFAERLKGRIEKKINGNGD